MEKELTKEYAIAQSKVRDFQYQLFALNSELSDARLSIGIYERKIEKASQQIALRGNHRQYVKALATARTKLDLYKGYEQALLEERAKYKKEVIWCLTQISDDYAALAVVDYLFYPDEPLCPKIGVSYKWYNFYKTFSNFYPNYQESWGKNPYKKRHKKKTER